MADLTPEQIKLLQQQNDLYRKQLDMQAEGYSLSTSYLESLKEILGIRSRISVSDSNILSLNKQINKEIFNQKTSYDNVKEVQKQIKKNEDLLGKSKLAQLTIGNQLTNNKKKEAETVAELFRAQRDLQAEIQAELDNAEKGLKINENLIESSKIQIALNEKNIEILNKGLTELQQQYIFNKLNSEELEKQNKQREIEKEKLKYIEKKLGLTGGLLKGLSAIPILGSLLKTEKALEAATKAAKEGGSALGVMGAAAKSMGGSLLSSLTDPLIVVGFLVKAFKFLLDYALKANQTITDLGRSMGVSNEEATKLYNHFGEVAKLSNETNTLGVANLITQQSLAEAYLQITKFAGATKGITDQQSKDQVFYNKKLQLSSEAQEGMFKLGSLNKMNGEAILKTIIKQTGALSKQTGIQFDNKTVIEQVSKVSGQLSANYKNDPALIAKAVVQANKLGLTLEGAANASSKLLDFESSIQNELEAELLTGKDLNLEKARLLALNGDAAGAAAEMLAQVGSLSEFQNMNVLQQEALAKAVGMTATELANSLRQQENLNNLGSENKKNIEEAAEALRAKGDIIGANALLNQTANDTEALAALEKNSAQEDFNILIDKLKATFGEMASGPLMDLLNDFTVWTSKTENILGLIDKIRMGFAALGAYMVGKFLFNIATMVAGFVTSAGAATATELAIKRSNTALIQSLVTQGTLTAAQGAGAIASLTTASASTLGIGIAPILAALGIAVAAFSTYMALKDGHIDSDGGLLVSGKKGTYQLDKNDSVIAGTDLMGDRAVKSDGSKGSILMGDGAVKSDGSKGSISFNSDSIVNELKRIEAMLQNTYEVQANIEKGIKASGVGSAIFMDSTHVGTATNIGTYKVQ